MKDKPEIYIWLLGAVALAIFIFYFFGTQLARAFH